MTLSSEIYARPVIAQRANYQLFIDERATHEFQTRWPKTHTCNRTGIPFLFLKFFEFYDLSFVLWHDDDNGAACLNERQNSAIRSKERPIRTNYGYAKVAQARRHDIEKFLSCFICFGNEPPASVSVQSCVTRSNAEPLMPFTRTRNLNNIEQLFCHICHVGNAPYFDGATVGMAQK